MSQSSLDKAQEWASNTYFDEESRKEIQTLLDNGDETEIEERFYKDLEFGTGGMRSILGQGSNRMNKYNIRKATQALANEVLATKSTGAKVAISYDSRKFSFEFAKEAASVFAGNGIKALIYKRLNPVSLVSFAIRHHGCQAGIMVTASHNPPEYNGYKVFWSDGAQVTPPNDTNIIGNFNSISDYSTVKFLDFEEGIKTEMIAWMGMETEDLYYNSILTKAINPELCKERGTELKIAYTALHGTGTHPCMRSLQDLGLTNIVDVPEQREPDGTFPTVSSPNPENAEALERVVALMKKENADLAMGTDPDTDRVGLAVLYKGEVVYPNGNQIGILMLHYILSSLKEQGKLPANPYFVKTIVTTELQAKIAEHFGCRVENTLTGFKWICGRMAALEKSNPELNFVFATEESFGYLNHGFVRDKDGPSSIALISEMALWYKTKGMNLVEGLDKIYQEFGFSQESLLCLNYYGKDGAEKIGRIMDNFRSSSDTELCGTKISKREDYKSGEAKNYSEGSTEKLDFPSSNVLGYLLDNGNKLYLRPSGTEPKIKFYIMIQESEGSLDEKREKALKVTNEILNFVKTESEKA